MASLPPRTARKARPRITTTPAPQPEDCAADVLDTVPAVMDALRGAMRAHVGEHLSVPQFRCLNFVANKPGASIGDVANFLGVTMPTASAMVDRLVRAGSVLPDTDPQDRRRSRLQITEAGRAQLREIRRGAHSDLARTLAARSADELRALQAGIDVLRQAFQTPRL